MNESRGLIRAYKKRHPKKALFLKFYAMMGNVSYASKKAKIGRVTVYQWLKKDDKFVRAMQLAGEEAVEHMEQEAFRRAMQGVKEPLYFQGDRIMEMDAGGKMVPAYVTKYSDTLMIFLLKGHNPKKYRERGQIELVGSGGGPIKIEDKTIKEPEEIAEILTILAESGEIKPESIENLGVDNPKDE